MADDTARTTAIETNIVSRTAEDSAVGLNELADALEVLAADLQGRHSEFEGGSYTTVEDRRAYAIDSAMWDSLFEPCEFEEPLKNAVRQAHERQAEALFVAGEGEGMGDASGVVSGIDTAEQFE